MTHSIFLAKESRAGEQRVALVPADVAVLSEKGHSVFIESGAGSAAGFNDADYQSAGATVVNIPELSFNTLSNIFKEITMIVRAKRPDREREQLESKTFQPGTILIGALDPFESNSNHIAEYHEAGIHAYSIDQEPLPIDDPANLLASMSRLAGKLALEDAVSKSQGPVKNVVIIGYGTAGKAALQQALSRSYSASVIVGSEKKVNDLKEEGVKAHAVDRSLPLQEQQMKILSIIKEADIVITTARKSGQVAPLLIPKHSLDQMKPHAVIVDMAISEGGNVFGSKHDETIKTDRNLLITNVSGYPKIIPHEASILWSQATLGFILRLEENPSSIQIKPC